MKDSFNDPFSALSQGADPASQSNPQSFGDPFDELATPQSVTTATKSIGDQSDNGLCQAFVEKAVYGKDGIFPSASAAWDYYSQNNLTRNDTKYMRPGSLIYFAPDKSNGNSGHVGIYAGDGNMISATYDGVQKDNIGLWQRQTGQQILGYVPVNK